ncbi:MAG: class I SAM-dependent methyltransferase [Planctomycetota bacterium]
MPSDARERAKALSRQAVAAGDSSAWFEPLYQQADGNVDGVPWADDRPNPMLVDWLDSNPGDLGRILVVGCGLGEDAEALAPRATSIVAFDLSATAIEWCQRRWPESRVEYVVADAANPPVTWRGSFDFVFESYTLQALLDPQRSAVMRQLPRLLAADGRLLLQCRGRDDDADVDGPPWPLSRNDLRPLEGDLTLDRFEDLHDPMEPEVRRFRVLYRRSSPA